MRNAYVYTVFHVCENCRGMLLDRTFEYLFNNSGDGWVVCPSCKKRQYHDDYKVIVKGVPIYLDD